jgi:hypothetical protein
MQLRCSYCQTMFAISRDEMLAGLEHMTEHQQTYYDAHCPKCRRANRVEKSRMERFFPDWQKAIRLMAKESAQAEATPAAPVTASPPEKVEKKPVTRATPAEKKPALAAAAKSKPAAKKPAPAAPAKGTPTAAKPAKAAPAKAKLGAKPTPAKIKPAPASSPKAKAKPAGQTKKK